MKSEKTLVKIIDIFGNTQSDNIQIERQNINKTENSFPKIDISIGLNNNQLQYNSILIHRLLQKRLNSNLNKNIQKLIKILINEMNSKANKYDIDIITRDTLLEYYVK